MKRAIPGFRRSRIPRRRTFFRQWREFNGLTQDHLAELLDTSKATISRIENGETPYTQDFLEACADTLGVHPSVLITRAPTDADRLPSIEPPRTPDQRKRR
jgi:transcriptional regulator with XRE-family HTH domain